MSFLISIIIGLIVGWLASLIMGVKPQTGCVGYIILGLIGSLVGKVLTFVVGLGFTGGLVASVIGAVIVLAIYAYYEKRNGRN